ncbi:Cro/Cl family transcriptional regulator [Edwardsiella ictaluri]|uniref:antirepressor protein Cro n=1 Tax=Edwardsiella ictaluri TaxID=67780 RepID=UPI00054D1C14|nr:antirepressor protein Cro [Edwardsiella ictaluri]AVZ83503.1 Cro/Cl family transcriptional regulator [Edwardsiella ictaluri]QPW30347.1 Cro/Cl family transcriptional regulator [Edwardsiella ictaluri]WJH21361.1 helix-turn-helix domain-containing protein [Edwardsiella ictaluri]STP81179.1 Uncharacterised protein [Edwardsiella ictaluri]BEH99291.1 hypothetical protein KH20906_20190 [Edwardsiella ictaluri]
MNELRIYLNGLSQIDQASFVSRCGTSIGYLRKAISTNQTLGAELSVLIEKESGGVVTRQHLHPEKWASIWPELLAV